MKKFHSLYQRTKTIYVLLGIGILAISAVSVSLFQWLSPGLFAPSAPQSRPAAYQVLSDTCHIGFDVVPEEPTPTFTQTPTVTIEPSVTEAPTVTLEPTVTPELTATLEPTITDSPTPEATSTPVVLGNTCNPIKVINSSDSEIRPFRIDDTLQLECGPVVNADSYQFRIIVPGGGIFDLEQLVSNSRLSQPFMPSIFNAGYGRYSVQCRGCLDTTCQDWESLP